MGFVVGRLKVYFHCRTGVRLIDPFSLAFPSLAGLIAFLFPEAPYIAAGTGCGEEPVCVTMEVRHQVTTGSLGCISTWEHWLPRVCRMQVHWSVLTVKYVLVLRWTVSAALRSTSFFSVCAAAHRLGPSMLLSWCCRWQVSSLQSAASHKQINSWEVFRHHTILWLPFTDL